MYYCLFTAQEVGIHNGDRGFFLFVMTNDADDDEAKQKDDQQGNH